MHIPTSTDVTTTFSPKWFRIPAACAYSGMSRAKLYQLMTEGQLKSICVRKKGNIRGLRLISAEGLDAFLESFVTEGV
jgi:hypothetical protein